MSKKIILVAGLLCGIVGNLSARGIVMGVDSVLAGIARHNVDVRAATAGYNATCQGIAVAESAKLPNVTASLDLNYLGDGTILDRDFTNAMRDKLPHFGNTLSVNIYQPVYQGGAITAGIDLARQQSELAAIGVEQQTDASGIRAIASFFNLMKMHNLQKVYVENIALTERLIAQMRERQMQGTALKNDVTRYELRLSSLRYDLQSVQNSISVLNNDLVTLLGMPSDTEIEPEATISTPDTGTEDYWQQLTEQASSELKALDKTRQMNGTEQRLINASSLPSVGIVIGDQLSGPVTFEIPALNKNYNAWYVGVNVKYNLSSLWTANKKLQQNRLKDIHITDQREAMSTALSRRVHEAYVAMQQARQMLDTEQVNVRLANENYEVVNTRFQNEMALLTDMLDASTTKLDSEVRLVNAQINLTLAYYQLKFISGTLYK